MKLAPSKKLDFRHAFFDQVGCVCEQHPEISPLIKSGSDFQLLPKGASDHLFFACGGLRSSHSVQWGFTCILSKRGSLWPTPSYKGSIGSSPTLKFSDISHWYQRDLRHASSDQGGFQILHFLSRVTQTYFTQGGLRPFSTNQRGLRPILSELGVNWVGLRSLLPRNL